MKINEELIDRLFDGLPVYAERRFEVFHEAAEALGRRVINDAGKPCIDIPIRDKDEIMAKLPKLAYEVKRFGPSGLGSIYRIRPL